MNHYTCYALKSEGGDYARTDAIEQCSFNGGTQLTFSMDIYCTMHNGIVFSQANSVACLLEDGSIIWKGNGWEVIADKNYASVIMDEWNHIDVVYERDKVKLYLNGIKVDEKEISAATAYSTEEYRYLEGYTGYIKSVRMADHAMTDDEIRENLIITNIPKENLWLWIPFDEPEPKDYGKYGKIVQCKGFCQCQNFVKALYFSGDGYALLDGITDNPGSSECPGFTVVMRVLPDIHVSESAVLFENTGKEDGFVICLAENQKKLQVCFNASTSAEQKFIFDTPILNGGQWTDIAVSVDGTELKAYINGIFARSYTMNHYVRNTDPHMVLGDGFAGAIDYFSIYDKVLSDSEISQIHEIEPYIYDDNIKTLFLLHGEQMENFLGEGTVLLHNQVEFRMIEGTLTEGKIEPFDFRTGSAFAGSDFEEWEAEVIAAYSLSYAAVSIGVGVNVLADAGLKDYISNRMVDTPAAQKMLIDYQRIKPEHLSELMTPKMIDTKTVSTLSTAVTKGVITGAASVAATKMTWYQMAVTIGGATAFGAAVATIVINTVNTPEDPPEDKDDSKPKKGYKINIQSIRFCNGTEGSIPLRETFGAKQKLPEWNRGQGKGVCAYSAKEQQPKIHIAFKYIPAKDQSPVTIKIGLRDSNLLGDHLSEEVRCSSPDTVYETDIICTDNKLQKAGMGKVSETICFYKMESGKPDPGLVGYAAMDIHILCKDPIKPWSTVQEEKTPLIPMLDIAAEVAEASKGPTKDEESFLEAITAWITGNTKFKLLNTDVYSRCPVDNVEFSFEEFFGKLQGKSLEAGVLDYYAFALELASMEGLGLELYTVFGLEKVVRSYDGKARIDTTGIKVDACSAFGKEITNRFSRIYLIGVKNLANTYWDILFFKSTNKTTWGKVTWETYKEHVIESFCYVNEPLKLGGWKEVTGKEICPISIIYDNGLFVKSERWRFKNYVKTNLLLKGQKARCHRASYCRIEEILIATFNGFKNGSINCKDKNDILNYLLSGFYPEGYLPLPGEENNMIELEKCCEFLMAVNTNMLEDDDTCEECSEILNRVLCCLNSACSNLRIGDASWNSSIREGFDPQEWFVVIAGEAYGEGPKPEDAFGLDNGFYFQNEDDVRMITILIEIGQCLGINFLFIQQGLRVYLDAENNQVIFPVIYSSSNLFDLDQVQDMCVNLPYYYKGEGGWTRFLGWQNS